MDHLFPVSFTFPTLQLSPKNYGSKRRRLESLESLDLHRHCWSPKPSFRSWSFRWKASKVTSPSIHLKILRSFIVIFSWCYDLLHPIQFLIIFAANLLTDEYRSLSLFSFFPDFANYRSDFAFESTNFGSEKSVIEWISFWFRHQFNFLAPESRKCLENGNQMVL